MKCSLETKNQLKAIWSQDSLVEHIFQMIKIISKNLEIWIITEL